ncbi:MAG TPA: hypothetical protein VFQ53_26725 [Kofleriaceae bacterium]|nr:hypothetical protein [Kofleriaceae bacterium]
MRRLLVVLALSTISLGSFTGCKKSGCERLAEMVRTCAGTREPRVMRGQIDAEFAGACDAAVEHDDTAMKTAVSCAESTSDCDELFDCLAK